MPLSLRDGGHQGSHGNPSTSAGIRRGATTANRTRRFPAESVVELFSPMYVEEKPAPEVGSRFAVPNVRLPVLDSNLQPTG